MTFSAVIGVLYIISEVLPFIPWIKANGVAQLVLNGSKVILGILRRFQVK